MTSHQAVELLSIMAVPASPQVTVSAFYFQQPGPHLKDSVQGCADNGSVKEAGQAAIHVPLLSSYWISGLVNRF